jgi:hypothetical protein
MFLLSCFLFDHSFLHSHVTYPVTSPLIMSAVRQRASSSGILHQQR